MQVAARPRTPAHAICPPFTCWITVDGTRRDRVDVAAEQRDDRRAGAGVRNVHQLDAGARGNISIGMCIVP
jgi:hypothetical protein